jgi:hypothetical protein
VIEFFGGILVAIGLFTATRPSSFSGEMAVAGLGPDHDNFLI